MAPVTFSGVTKATQLVSNKVRKIVLVFINSSKSLVVKSGNKMGKSAEKYWFVQN